MSDRETEGALEYWADRGAKVKGVEAVLPSYGKPGWESWTRENLLEYGMRRITKHGGSRFTKAIDLGCGVGDWSVRLAAISDRMVCLDYSPELAAQTEARLAGLGHGSFAVTSGDCRKFDDYDGAQLLSMAGLLTYLDDDDVVAMMTRARQKMAPDAIIYQRDCCTINFGREKRNVRPGFFSVHRRPSRYVKLFEKAGWKLIERRNSASIHGEQSTWRTVGFRKDAPTAVLGWPARFAFRLATVHWYNASQTFLYRAA
jgi:hypothetical protein